MGVMQLGEHGCLRFGSAEEHWETAARYIADGLGRGERIIHLDDGGSAEAVLQRLAEDGVDVSDALAGGRLLMLPAEHAALLFKSAPEVAADTLARQLGEALDAGYTGCRVVIEVTDATLVEQRIDAVGRELAGRPGATLWLYDGALWPDHRLEPSADGLTAPTVFDDGILRVTDTGPGRLRLAGEADLSNRAALRQALEDAVDPERGLRLHLASLRFIEVAGIEAMMALAARLPGNRQLVLEGTRPIVRRILQVCGGLDIPQLVLGDAPGR